MQLFFFSIIKYSLFENIFSVNCERMKEIHRTCILNHTQNSYFLYFLFLNCITFNQGDKPHTFYYQALPKWCAYYANFRWYRWYFQMARVKKYLIFFRSIKRVGCRWDEVFKFIHGICYTYHILSEREIMAKGEAAFSAVGRYQGTTIWASIFHFKAHAINEKSTNRECGIEKNGINLASPFHTAWTSSEFKVPVDWDQVLKFTQCVGKTRDNTFAFKSSPTILYTSNLEMPRHIPVYPVITCTLSAQAAVTGCVLMPRQTDMSEAERPSCFLLFCQLVTDYKMKTLFLWISIHS